MILVQRTADHLYDHPDPTAGVPMFFGLLSLLLDGSIPIPELGRVVGKIVMQLGQKYVQDEPTLQERVFNAFLNASAPLNPMSDGIDIILELFEIFNPSTVIVLDRGIYWTLIVLLATLPNQLSIERETALVHRFEAVRNVPELIASSTDDERETLFTLLPTLMSRPALASLCSQIVQALLSYEFPKNVDRILDTILSAVCEGSVASWETLFGSIRLEALDASTAIRLIGTLNERLPLPDKYMNVALQLARSIMMGIPKFIQQLKEESQDYYNRLSGTAEILEGMGSYLSEYRAWNAFQQFLISALKPSAPTEGTAEFLSVPNFGVLLGIMTEIITQTPLWINKIWEIYSDILTTYMSVTQSINNDTIHQFLRSLPWAHAIFHVYDRDLPKAMVSYLINADHMAISIMYANLNWKKFTEHVISHKTDVEESSRALWLLKLMMYIHILNPSIHPESAKSLLSLGDEAAFPWREMDLSQFEMIFNGKTFTTLLEECGTSDPSKALVECCLCLNELVRDIQPVRPSIAATVVSEIRSIMFYSIQADIHQRLYWHLPYVDHVTLLTAILIPMLRSHGNENISSHLLVAILSCLNHSQTWPSSYLLSSPRNAAFFNATFIPGEKISEQEAKKFREFSQKIKGIIQQFAASTSPAIALETLNVASQAISMPEELVEIFEETLHSYFSHSDSGHASAQAAASLQLEIQLEKMVQICTDSHASLTLRVILEHDVRNVSKLSGSHISFILNAVSKFLPNKQHYEMDLLALWIFVLDMLASDKWTFDKNSEEGLALFERTLEGYIPPKARLPTNANKIKSFLGAIDPKGNKTPEIMLAAAACHLFLERILIQKRGSKGEEGSQRLLTLSDLLQQLRGESQFENYGPFFDEAQDFLSPLCDLPSFKATIVKTLAPTYLYLQNLL
eukprot:TRINITY_DN1353_c1_g1_i1.p1 TRINITY_DN1353_c1_g1~~TRINITY_DN1353_c1_g1_i1.p1  ORF type:complete len:913 (+),score=310.90 TRINITY_DN1353_c1_g1_i1:585-3323(+)